MGKPSIQLLCRACNLIKSDKVQNANGAVALRISQPLFGFNVELATSGRLLRPKWLSKARALTVAPVQLALEL
jgi:hypothetical protein